MIEIEKTNKPESFRELYQRANPLPGIRPKVPLLHLPSSNDNDEEVVLCESTVIVDYLATSAIDESTRNQDSSFLPVDPKDRAQLRLFVELCGSSFSSYLSFSRVQSMPQVEEQYAILQDEMTNVNAFLSARFEMKEFTWADAHMAPFVQRCCGILPAPYDPISIAKDLDLANLQSWIKCLLERKSVKLSAPLEEIHNKREKVIKRLARIQSRE